MIEYSGSTVFGNGEIVTGRICDADTLVGISTSGGANIVLWDGVERVSESVMKSAVGLVAPSEYAWRACAVALPYTVPVMCVNISPDGFDSLYGSVAILDTAKQRLYVDPDIEKISSMLKNEAREQVRIPRFAFVNGAALESGFDGAVVECCCENSDEEYKMLCDVADANTGMRIVAIVRFDGVASDFCRHVTNVFRAGVWGRFSLLCAGVYTPSRWRECALAIHSVFRSLDVSGREFNGFIPRGIVIDTPALLLDKHDTRELDLYCFDVDALISRFCGTQNDACGVRHVYEYVQDICKRDERARVALRIREGTHSELCGRLCEREGGFELYINDKKLEKK